VMSAFMLGNVPKRSECRGRLIFLVNDFRSYLKSQVFFFFSNSKKLCVRSYSTTAVEELLLEYSNYN